MKNQKTIQIECSIIKESGEFDEKWYMYEYKDVQMLGKDPVYHYVTLGASMQRRPNENFRNDIYIRMYPKLKKGKCNPFVHHIQQQKIGLSKRQFGKDNATRVVATHMDELDRMLHSFVHSKPWIISNMLITFLNKCMRKKSGFQSLAKLKKGLTQYRKWINKVHYCRMQKYLTKDELETLHTYIKDINRQLISIRKSKRNKLAYVIFRILSVVMLKKDRVYKLDKAYEKSRIIIKKIAEYTRICNESDNDAELQKLYSFKSPFEEKLKVEYFNKGLQEIPDTFALYRILGNDLYPRHKRGQTRENLELILKHEPSFHNCKKYWIINRIVDVYERSSIIKLLNEYNQEYVDIPFMYDEYRKICINTDILPRKEMLFSKEFFSQAYDYKNIVTTVMYKDKNRYVMNNNGARNFALAHGKERAKWVLPFDGNCFFSKHAWEELYNAVIEQPWLKFFVVPMSRALSNESLLNNDKQPEPSEEPQIIFRFDTKTTFNDEFFYGRRPKVEIFWTLGIPGRWDKWEDCAWDVPRRERSDEALQFGVAGWVSRLFSGVKNLEINLPDIIRHRGRVREEAILSTLRHIDMGNVFADEKATETIFIHDALLNKIKEIYYSETDRVLPYNVACLVKNADDALARDAYSVVNKLSMPPSGDPHDYWHLAPYWWPNPDTHDGLPYIYKDGERVPGTVMYEPDSDRYDRTRLQRVFDDTVTLVLAWKITGEKKYSRHAVHILDSFFVNPETRMNPHLKYAQVIMGHNNNMGTNYGIIEFKDLYYYLDAVRILENENMVDVHIISEFKIWLERYLDWLLTSPQGIKECQNLNNHGTYYDLQVSSIAAYLAKENLLYDTFARAQSRISQQINPDGSQPKELQRKTTEHYCFFNLQGFLHIAMMAQRWGIDIWNYVSNDGSSLKNAVDWLLGFHQKEWPFTQIDEFDKERYYPLYFTAAALGLEKMDGFPNDKLSVKSVFYPHDGIIPYWNLMF